LIKARNTFNNTFDNSFDNSFDKKARTPSKLAAAQVTKDSASALRGYALLIMY